MNCIYFVETGSVSLTRQVDIVRHNRLPVDRSHWDRLDTTITKSFVVDVVNENDCFGDDAALGVISQSILNSQIIIVIEDSGSSIIDISCMPVFTMFFINSTTICLYSPLSVENDGILSSSTRPS